MLMLLHGEAVGGNIINGFLQIVCSAEYRRVHGVKHVTAGISTDSVVSMVLYLLFLNVWVCEYI